MIYFLFVWALIIPATSFAGKPSVPTPTAPAVTPTNTPAETTPPETTPPETTPPETTPPETTPPETTPPETTPTAPNAPPQPAQNTPNTGAIVGGVLGGTALLATGIGAAVHFGRKPGVTGQELSKFADLSKALTTAETSLTQEINGASKHLREVLVEHGEKISMVEVGQSVKIHPQVLSPIDKTGPYNTTQILVTEGNIDSIKASVKDLTTKNLEGKSFKELLDLHDLHRPSKYIPHAPGEVPDIQPFTGDQALAQFQELNAAHTDVSDAIDVSQQNRYKQLLQQQKTLEERKIQAHKERTQLVEKLRLQQGKTPKQPGQQDLDKLSKIKKAIAQTNGAIDQQINALDQEHQKLFLDHYASTEHVISLEKFQETAKKINDIPNLSKATKNQHAKLLKDIATLRTHKAEYHQNRTMVRE